MEAQKLKGILDEHQKWLMTAGKGGAKADLHSADLHSADLRSANLRFANLYSADLRDFKL